MESATWPVHICLGGLTRATLFPPSPGQEFAHLMEDERYREGRLLRRFFELLEGGASPHDASFPSSTPASTLRLGDTTPFEVSK